MPKCPHCSDPTVSRPHRGNLPPATITLRVTECSEAKLRKPHAEHLHGYDDTAYCAGIPD